MTGGSVGFAFVLGMVALINPCGFPLLAIYLTAFADSDRRSALARAQAGVRAGLAVTLGFVAVFSAAGLVAGSLHAVVLGIAPWLMLVVAVAIVVLGVAAVCGEAVPFHAAPRFRSGPGVIAMLGFGAAYAVGSLSCALPIFVAAVGSGLASGSGIVTGAVVVAYGLGMGLFATVLAVIASLTGGLAVAKLRRAGAVLPRIAGAVCIVIGIYLAGYWLGEVGGPQVVGPVTLAFDAVQGLLTTVIEDAWLPVGAALATIVIGLLVLVAHHAGVPAAASEDPVRRKEP